MNNIIKTIGELHLQILKHPGMTLRALLLAGAASTLGAAGVYGQSVPLPPGSTDVPLPGTTDITEPDLAGPILADQIIPFVGIDNATGGIAITGTLQDRVVQETLTGNLDFYGHITITDFGNNLGAIDSIGMGSFAGFTVNANFRTDGAGVQGPNAASSSSDGSEIAWYFESPQRLGAPGGASESLFFFAQTDAQNFDSNGSARIVDYSLVNGGINPTIDLSGIYEPVPVPEPATLAWAGLGGLAALVSARRRK
jgi:hypothetical protein